MKTNIFIDDSGQLHIKYPKKHMFIYGGFWAPENEVSKINTYYSIIKMQLFKSKKEVKGSNMSPKIKKRIINRICKKFPQGFHPIFICVNVDNLDRLNFNNKRSVQLFKNYLIRRLIEIAILDQRRYGYYSRDTDIFIDNQSKTQLGFFDSLEPYLNKYFHDRYASRTYIKNSANFKAKFLDSKASNLIQIADILANSKYQYYTGKFDTFKIIMSAKKVKDPLKLP
ncbi:hypothetical protein JG29_04940 [Bombilactobacillus mellis]|uniref:DUF3800 domain-containing protein n=1 Tax=Bombilactobacillus mellis TaxID=1218508 RepID=A0A0F4KW63_9LACO|nr:DUF3800 domain-containing protein [Bombilactobacillus mellis]KJY49441.1 hypothetical protein JG29_04940 [Bombilactobacillus mellis]